MESRYLEARIKKLNNEIISEWNNLKMWRCENLEIWEYKNEIITECIQETRCRKKNDE